MYHHGLIAPIISLVCWTLFVMAWLGYERIRNIVRLRLKPDAGRFARDLDSLMPERARQVSANYMHLMEQPTIFYAVCFGLQFLGQADHSINIGLAWGYVATRMLHSLVHCTFNNVRLRFMLFLISSTFLIALTVHAVMAMVHLSQHTS
jgi:hypothetical protein